MSHVKSISAAFSAPLLPEHKRVIFIAAFLMALVVGTALAFEIIGGYIPCALCLEQRMPYYTAIPILLIAGVAAMFTGPAVWIRALIFLAGLAMVFGTYLGVFHSGVEWGWWPGPTDCTTVVDGVSANASNLLGDLNAKKPPSCDKAALRILGLSFAGWNVIASAFLAFFTLRLAFRK